MQSSVFTGWFICHVLQDKIPLNYQPAGKIPILVTPRKVYRTQGGSSREEIQKTFQNENFCLSLRSKYIMTKRKIHPYKGHDSSGKYNFRDAKPGKKGPGGAKV